ncbi:anion transporter [Candidatus Vecturithrix granuli]|uniref:Anion transporter n=1 Tax=Vecturithrix granuli TaxID=1499967 RepID=A0A081C7N5_VECG1|nr:anion transporter [Candidatus Vecturithrix granuli]
MAVAAMLLPLGMSILRDAGVEPLKSNFGRALMISCAWGALIGGIATPAGCGPNPLTMGFLRDLAGIEFSFLDWMIIGVPAMILMIPCAWIILLKCFPLEEINLKITEEEFKQRFVELGRLTRKEIWMLVIFGVTIFLWIFGPLIENWIGSVDYLSIYFVALTFACILFFPGVNVLSWKQAEQQISWGGIILIVTGLAMGMAIYNTGAAEWLAWMAFHSIGALHPALIVFVIVLGVSILKVMFSSNTVTGTIAVPLLIALAKNLDLDPVLLGIPAGITSSLAFILVTSTPTNVIPYSSGYFSIGDMAKAGIWMTIMSSVCVTISIYVMGKLFGLITF